MNRRRVLQTALAAIALAANAAGCGQDPTAITTQPVMLDDWPAIHRELIVPGCAFGSCHAGAQPAAHLDLSQPSSCRQLVSQRSCLFPEQMLVAAGDVTGSFLHTKLTGQGLGPVPPTTCGGGTNQRMPFGAQPLPDAQIAAVAAWIAAGASCGDVGGPGPDNLLPPPVAPPPALPVVIAGIDAPEQPLPAGQQSLLGVRLSAPAPAGGAVVTLIVSDRTILGAPVLLLVGPGASAATTPIIGKRPGVAQVSARIDRDAETPTVAVAVSGLAMAEVAADGDGGSSWLKLANTSDASIDLAGYRLAVGTGDPDDATTRLTGILKPGTCYLVGAADVTPALDWTFAPAATAVRTGLVPAIVFALFDAATPTRDPFAGLLESAAFGPGGPAATGGDSAGPTLLFALPTVGHSALRRGSQVWVEQASPTPQLCDVSFARPAGP